MSPSTPLAERLASSPPELPSSPDLSPSDLTEEIEAAVPEIRVSFYAQALDDMLAAVLASAEEGNEDGNEEYLFTERELRALRAIGGLECASFFSLPLANLARTTS